MEAKYIQFPISFLRNLTEEPKQTIEQILHFGIYQFSTRVKYKPEALSKQFIYWTYRKRLPRNLSKMKANISWKYLGQDDDYNGFTGDTFNPCEEELKEVEDTLERDKLLLLESIEFYRFQLALGVLGLSATPFAFENGRELVENQTKGEPMPMVNTSILMNYYKEDKDVFQLEQLAAYISLKSILGKTPYCKTNKNHIRARMFGYSRFKDIPENVKESTSFKKYEIRYQMDKLLNYLRDDWYVKTYSKNMRGMMIAIGDDVSYETIVKMAHESKRKSKRNQRLKAIRDAERKLMVSD